ncbi:MAG: flagellar basal-body rod protein FlgB [Acidobacteriaceae bacterium]|nr:flagellar basal-body rod protein FlgB [Acidobacteriaceae bacterium]
MNITTPLADQLTRYLDLSAAQLKATATNMANIDTPGFRTVGFDFEAEMQRALGGSASPGGSETPQLQEVDGLLARPDGNNVSMDREGLVMAEAQLKFRAGVELAKREYARVLDSIHADSSK